MYEAGTSLDWNCDTNVCLFHILTIKTIIVCWVLNHTGIGGNKKADSVAKSALVAKCQGWCALY